MVMLDADHLHCVSARRSAALDPRWGATRRDRLDGVTRCELPQLTALARSESALWRHAPPDARGANT
eukprot:239755-Pyramimonas_sp.AAC.2